MKPVLYFFKQLYAYSGKKLHINLIGMVLISFLDGIGLLLLIPVISYSGIANFETGNSNISKVFGFLQQIPTFGGLTIILLMFLMINIIQNLITRYITIENVKIQHGFARHLRLEIYRDLLCANWDFYIKRRKSDLINTITAELARVSAGTNTFLQFITGIIFTFIQIGIALLLSPQITMFVLLSGLVLSLFSRGFIKRSQKLGSRTSEIAQSFLAGITDNFNGIKDIKSNTLEQSRMNWFRSISQRMYNEQMEYITIKTASQFYYKMASAVLISIFIFLSVNLFNSQAAQLMLIIIIFTRLWPRVTGIQASLEQIATTVPALKSVIKLINESKNAKEIYELDYQTIQPINIRDGIECKNVFFRYNTNENNYALNGINVFFPSNRMSAVVGKSGAGKSTLIDLLMGLNQPEKGEILLDGVRLSKDNLLSLRRSVSYVPQDPFLFNTTIKENLQLIYPDATEDQMWEALQFAAADEFVRKLPQQLDTLIGDRGIRLSGGERQRLVLARAVLRKPSILVLDEATSSLDTENEAKIQEALERLKGRMTIVVIAHRLSTIRNADQVIVLDKGEIIQIGEFGHLAREKSGMFRNLLGKQMEAVL
ncbi:ABC transporter ATP-binding protein [Lederbergia wuyishanensis]|uniref:ATP-binding cassette subfamily C protein n=1 Tax=Lederbergia wuyishanensis TaxID=1347903 RepID=A0ABU0D7Q8_9BACI|nr:ABC transporter ATP-binding protein [Lederbergia wuyishanensis]MCJ8009112.1 ABC transporter ATP-binding protein/permease [Lederbergia wuyishanensis]MDQ0344451.1 ATP-binding cassette subfamily C protein [Lederbergia wuyishanensis]